MFVNENKWHRKNITKETHFIWKYSGNISTETGAALFVGQRLITKAYSLRVQTGFSLKKILFII